MSKIYFASDFHLGVPTKETSLARERKIVRWLEMAAKDATAIYLVGDLFDYWFEYRKVVPKGFVRFLGTLAKLRDEGVDIQVFTGNHDLWMFGYFEEELGITVHHGPIELVTQGKKLLVGHGDGLGPGDHSYKLLKKIFTNRFFQRLFSWIHPNTSIAIANYWSRKSRYGKGVEEEPYLGDDKEWLVQFCKSKLDQEHIDYFVFGHRHLVLDIQLPENSRYINLGEWLNNSTYAVLENGEMRLAIFND